MTASLTSGWPSWKKCALRHQSALGWLTLCHPCTKVCIYNRESKQKESTPDLRKSKTPSVLGVTDLFDLSNFWVKPLSWISTWQKNILWMNWMSSRVRPCKCVSDVMTMVLKVNRAFQCIIPDERLMNAHEQWTLCSQMRICAHERSRWIFKRV